MKPAFQAHEAVAISKHQAVTDEEESQRRHAEIKKVLGQDVAGILGSNESGFDHAKAGLHEEHRERRDEHPHGV
jgi:hypothetical protein